MTKDDLEASLKKMMRKKPIQKITIQDLTTDCGISRMAFYYHFKDIYDLVEWSCEADGRRALQGKKTYDTWQEGLLQIFEVVLENKTFIMNVYHNVSREQIEGFLYKMMYQLLKEVVEEQAQDEAVSEEEKEFIANLYKYSFVGILLDWIRLDMKEDPKRLVEKISTALHGNIANSVKNFSRN